jgi:hypothetical protein
VGKISSIINLSEIKPWLNKALLKTAPGDILLHGLTLPKDNTPDLFLKNNGVHIF